jgi:hypothetical protein
MSQKEPACSSANRFCAVVERAEKFSEEPGCFAGELGVLCMGPLQTTREKDANFQPVLRLSERRKDAHNS